MVNKSEIIIQTEAYVKSKMAKDYSGHDWFHIKRVVTMAKVLAKHEEHVDLFIVELAALLHDIGDWKFHKGDSSVGEKKAREWLTPFEIPETIIDEVCFIVAHISYKGGTNTVKMRTVEGKIVQDADRLDAMGAIGIARTFAYGGFKGREIYNPGITPKQYGSLQEYMEANNTTINHFHEKLLLVKDGMHSPIAKKIAAKSHKFLEKFLYKFFKEWERKDH